MKAKIVLEEHLSTALNNSMWDASGEAARNRKTYMDDVGRDCSTRTGGLRRWTGAGSTLRCCR